MASVDPLSVDKQKSKILSFSGFGKKSSPKMSTDEIELLIKSFETNTLVVDGENRQVSWNLKSTITQEQFIQTLKENTALRMGGMKFSGLQMSETLTESGASSTSINGRVVEGSSYSNTTVKNSSPSLPIHKIYFLSKGQMCQLEIGEIVKPVLQDDKGDKKELFKN